MIDNAKELLALAEKALREIYDITTDRRLVNRLVEIEKCAEETLNKIAALRLSARQQASVEEVAQAIFDGAPAHLWVAVTRPIARALLAKYDIFEKVEG